MGANNKPMMPLSYRDVENQELILDFLETDICRVTVLLSNSDSISANLLAMVENRLNEKNDDREARIWLGRVQDLRCRINNLMRKMQMGRA